MTLRAMVGGARGAWWGLSHIQAQRAARQRPPSRAAGPPARAAPPALKTATPGPRTGGQGMEMARIELASTKPTTKASTERSLYFFVSPAGFPTDRGRRTS